MKKLIRLTEADLYGIIDGCLRKYLNENTNVSDEMILSNYEFQY